MSLRNAIGGTIHSIRQDRQMTLRDLSSKSCVALGYISEVERGRKDPSDGVLEALASGLDLSMTDFIGEVYAYLKEQDGEA